MPPEAAQADTGSWAASAAGESYKRTGLGFHHRSGHDGSKSTDQQRLAAPARAPQVEPGTFRTLPSRGLPTTFTHSHSPRTALGFRTLVPSEEEEPRRRPSLGV